MNSTLYRKFRLSLLGALYFVVLSLLPLRLPAPVSPDGTLIQIASVTDISGISETSYSGIRIVEMPGSILTSKNADGSKTTGGRNLQLVLERQIGSSKAWSNWMQNFHTKGASKVPSNITIAYKGASSQTLFQMQYSGSVPVRYEIFNDGLWRERITVTFSSTSVL